MFVQQQQFLLISQSVSQYVKKINALHPENLKILKILLQSGENIYLLNREDSAAVVFFLLD